MTSSRLVLGFGLVLALTIALMLVLSSEEAEPEVPVSTTAQAAPSTAAPTTTPTTAERSAPSTTTLEHREEEVAAIVHGNLMTWFEAIYDGDSERLWDAVATQSLHDSGVEAMQSLSFDERPTSQGLSVDVLQILMDRENCVVVHYVADATAFLATTGTVTSVEVLWPDPDHGLRTAAIWSAPSDLWEPDCDKRLRESTP
ncbi:MAG: hypothetical protein ACE5MI_12380 [Acidimicrobiia bacterium]